MNFNCTDPDPEENPLPQDDNDSGWNTVPSDYNDVITKGDRPDVGESLSDD